MIYLCKHINYKNNNLWVENVDIKNISINTPYYCYSQQALIDNYQNIARSIPNALICYAVKANPNISVIKTFAQQGSGADVVSEGEIRRAMKAGIEKIVFSGVGKTANEIKFALENNIYQINTESIEELNLINQIAGNLNIKAPIAIRINLDIDGETLDQISTGRKQDKFGIDLQYLAEALSDHRKNLNIVGFSIHIGSQISHLKVFEKAFKKLEEVIINYQLDQKIKRLDLGGGFAIPYQDGDQIFNYEGYSKLLDRFNNYQIIIEPGRSLVGNAGILITKVLFVKHNNIHVIVDAGMNDMMRPALYGAYHNIIPVRKEDTEYKAVDIVGPVCESTDIFAKQRKMPILQSGDLLAICTVGAYGASMSNNYNSRLLPSEIMVQGDKYFTIRQQETYEEMINKESVL